MADTGMPDSAFKAMMFPLISSGGGLPTWVMLVRARQLPWRARCRVATYVWSAISFPATNQSGRFGERVPAKQWGGETRRTCDEPKVGVVERREVGHLGLAAVRVLAVLEELVDGVDGVRLDRIVGGEDDELGNVFLWRRSVAERRAERRGRTGSRPPGGLVLAQLHSGSLHLSASQE